MQNTLIQTPTCLLPQITRELRHQLLITFRRCFSSGPFTRSLHAEFPPSSALYGFEGSVTLPESIELYWFDYKAALHCLSIYFQNIFHILSICLHIVYDLKLCIKWVYRMSCIRGGISMLCNVELFKISLCTRNM